MLRILNLFVAFLAFAPVAIGHSWIEQMRNVDDNGNYVGQLGYPRGMIGKGDPGFSDTAMHGIIPELKLGVLITDKSPLCLPSQTKQQQSQDKYPRLKVVPGGFISMRYSENGHVTEPADGGCMLGKPCAKEGSGTVFIYGTTEPQEDEKLVTVLQWTQDGKGGNGKGVLLASMDFVDSRCYETNPTPESAKRRKATPNWIRGQKEAAGPEGNSPLLCESNVKIPESAQSGKPYTLYWVWQWPTLPKINPGVPNGKDEYYATCIDVDVTSKDIAHAAGEPNPPPQDTMDKAVPEWKSRTARHTDIFAWEMGPVFANMPKPGSGDTAPPAQSEAHKAPEPSPKAPEPSSEAPAPSSTPAPSPPAAASSSETPAPTPAATPKPSGPTIPIMSRRPGDAKPKPKPNPSSSSSAPPQGDDDDDMVTITDTVYLTVTADDSTSTAAADSKRAVTTIVNSPPAKVTPSASRTTLATLKSSQQPASQPSASAAASLLPGFDMRNKNGAKFRGMFT
jgi:hypothetical protein